MTADADRFFGGGDLDAFFSGQPRGLVPWARAPRRKHTMLITTEDQKRLLSGRPALCDLDPRTLHATQTFVLAEHCRYYATGRWHSTGTTARDREQLANRYPLIHTDLAGNHIILGGHHRALVALLSGTLLRARVLRPPDNDTAAVLPLLLAGTRTDLERTATADPDRAAHLVTVGTTALVPDIETARLSLHALGLDDDVIRDRISVATRSRVTAAA